MNETELYENALSLASASLTAAQLEGRSTVLQVLQEAVPIIASRDEGYTLWNIYEVLMEVESWWSTDR